MEQQPPGSPLSPAPAPDPVPPPSPKRGISSWIWFGILVIALGGSAYVVYTLQGEQQIGQTSTLDISGFDLAIGAANEEPGGRALTVAEAEAADQEAEAPPQSGLMGVSGSEGLHFGTAAPPSGPGPDARSSKAMNKIMQSNPDLQQKAGQR